MTESLYSVRMRLLALCLGMLLVLGGSSISVVFLIAGDQSARQQRQQQYDRFEAAQTVHEAQVRFQVRANELIGAQPATPEALAHALESLKAAEGTLDATLGDYARYDAEPQRLLEPVSNSVVRQARELATRDSGLDPLADNAALLGTLRRDLDVVEQQVSDTLRREQDRLRELQQQEQQRVGQTVSIAGIIIAAAILIGIGATYFVVRSIIKPLETTTTAIRKVNLGAVDIDLPPIRPDEFGDIAVALRQFRDQAENLRRLAYHDTLTGLGNRALLEETLQKAIDVSRETRYPTSIFFVDLDHFRAVNDKFGHKAGDRYLVEAATRLNRFMPIGSDLYRHGGDKFAVVVDDLDSSPDLETRLREKADTILGGMSEAFPFGEHLLNMSASIGVAVFPGDGETAEQLIASAEAAMYAAKKNGRNNVRFASAQLTGSMRRQLALTGDIRRGLERGEFEPFYQPVIDVERGIVVGAEALLRWRHPENGLMPPSDFIQVAEDTGLINDLGELCLIRAHEQTQLWASKRRRLRVSVNLSVRQLHSGRVIKLLRTLRNSAGSREALIDFELTESALLDNTEYSHSMLSEIKRLGYGIGLDDFGTGYSSFSYLQKLPIDKIKIDRQFVNSMGTSKQALAIISATMTLSQNLELGVIAEGVETLSQMRQLRLLGCKLQQGFYFTRALPVAEFEAWMTAFETQGMDAHAKTVATRQPVTIS